MADSDHTTIQVTHETWAALDRRKDRNESFDDVIQKLINATPVGVGELRDYEGPEIEHGSIEELTAAEMEGCDENCAHYDIISGEQCENEVEFRQQWRFPDEEEWGWFYYCKEHSPSA